MTSARVFVVFLAVVAGLPAGARANDLQLPNLTPLVPYDVQIAASDGYDGTDGSAPRALRFSISTRNTGDVPLELIAPPVADEVTGSATRKTAYQCVRWVDRACAEWRPVGDLVWHQAHAHWHFQDYARYELRELLADGTPDFRPEALIAPGEKASFCLEDTDPPGTDPEHDQYGTTVDFYADLVTTHSGLYAGCDATRQGISPGWADTYGFGLPGQQIPLADVPAGTYALVVVVDPYHRLYETSAQDNTAYRIVTIPAPRAGDLTPPHSTISTVDETVLTPVVPPVDVGIRFQDHVEGTAFDDDTGVAFVTTRWTDQRGTTIEYPATLSCADATQRSCDWSVTPAGPGSYLFSVTAVDRAGNSEPAGGGSIHLTTL